MRAQTHLLDRLQRPRRDFQPHFLLERLREKIFMLHVGEPCPPGFVLGEGDVVAVLLGFSLEEAQLGAFERLGDRFEEGSGRNHWRKSRRRRLGAQGDY